MSIIEGVASCLFILKCYVAHFLDLFLTQSHFNRHPSRYHSQPARIFEPDMKHSLSRNKARLIDDYVKLSNYRPEICRVRILRILRVLRCTRLYIPSSPRIYLQASGPPFGASHIFFISIPNLQFKMDSAQVKMPDIGVLDSLFAGTECKARKVRYHRVRPTCSRCINGWSGVCQHPTSQKQPAMLVARPKLRDLENRVRD